MSIRTDRRDAAIERMADHVLKQGLGGASLRALAAAAGTSDRMLLYYFVDRDELVAATLGHVAARLARTLSEARAHRAQLPFAALLAEVWAAFRSPDLQPYLQLWLELAAAAARGQEPYRSVAGPIADGFLSWSASQLLVEREADRAGQAALLVATLDGLMLLDAVGRPGAAELAMNRQPHAPKP